MTVEPDTTPDRFRAPLLHIIEDAMPHAFAADAGRWLYEHRDQMARCGDDDGVAEFMWALRNIDATAPEVFAPLRKRVLDALPTAIGPCKVPPFEPSSFDMASTLFHHGGHANWHRSCGTYESVSPTIAIGFVYFLHSDPKMFSGGDLEFLDGTAVEPKHNRLVFFAPDQIIRVRPVECWSAHVIHGRWALVGILHRAPATAPH